jgi:hypothetical protein
VIQQTPPQGQSKLEGIADFLENLPIKACVELTRSLLSTAYSFPKGEPSMATLPRTNGEKALRLAYSKADGVPGRELESEQLFSEHGVDIFLQNETNLESGRALRFANYVCHRTDRPAQVRGTAIIMLFQSRVCSTWMPLPHK